FFDVPALLNVSLVYSLPRLVVAPVAGVDDIDAADPAVVPEPVVPRTWPSTSDALSLAVSASADALSMPASMPDFAVAPNWLPVLVPYSFHFRWRRREISAPAAPAAAPAISRPPTIMGQRLCAIESPRFLFLALRAARLACRPPLRAVSVSRSSVGSSRSRAASNRGASAPAAPPAACAAAIRRCSNV